MTLKISTNGYPTSWNAITEQEKDQLRYRCPICDEVVPDHLRHTFQTHHLDHNRKNVDKENLLPTCQRCHERLQRVKITMGKTAMLAEIRKVNIVPYYQPVIY